MTFDLITALLLFAFVSSITPGPNNIMLMASGANFGLRRTLPHMFGVGFGFILMIVLVGLGLNGLFELYPAIQDVLKVVAIVYLLWLAWKIANAAPKADDMKSQSKPLTFLQAAAFQWVNPKAWTMAVTATVTYVPDGHWLAGVGFVALAFGAVNIPCITLWTWAGVQVRLWLNTDKRMRTFNYTMALLLIASLALILFM